MAIEGERLQKVLANAGLGSRREIEAWISAGRIKVNGQVAVLGTRVTPADRIQVGRQLIQKGQLLPVRRRVIAYHKPEGELVTRADPEQRPTVFKHLPRLQRGRWVAVGRLDINSAGLLLFTNDGELANRLMHPRQAVEREYAVRILGNVESAQLDQLTRGVELDDGPAAFDSVVDAGGTGVNHWYHVLIREGRQREVRRIWEAVGLRVSRLIRVRYGNVQLGRRLRAGQWRDLEVGEVRGLLKLVGMPVEPAPARRGQASRIKGVKSLRQRRGR